MNLLEDRFHLGKEIIDRIARDDRVRRELLWLRAMAEDDLDAARDLETVDPDVRRRLAAFVDENAAAIARDPRQAFRRMRDAWLEKSVRALFSG